MIGKIWYPCSYFSMKQANIKLLTHVWFLGKSKNYQPVSASMIILSAAVGVTAPELR